MNRINYQLESRLDSIKKRAEAYSKYNPSDAYKSALEWQVKYGRKGWRAYDAPNDYDQKGNMRLYNLDDYEAIPIQEVSRRAFDYSGYYADNFQYGLIKPYIVKIKTSRGLFIAPAIAYSDCDIATIYLSDGEMIEKNDSDHLKESIPFNIARIADSIAEREAEKSREDDAKFQAEEQAEALKADNLEARKEAHNLISAIRDQRAIGEIVAPICAALMNEIKGLRRTIQRNNERINALKNNYWLAVD